MTHDRYGCPCCTGALSNVFNVNKTFSRLKTEAASGQGWSCNWGIDWTRMGRRDFIKTGAAGIGLAALSASEGRAQTAAADQTTTVFTNGTVLTVDDDFSEASAPPVARAARPASRSLPSHPRAAAP